MSYAARREWVAHYFDRAASANWAALTSDTPVGYVRRTVREGRERMRLTLLGWLPRTLRGARVLDAGCGTGAIAVELARRGAHVVAVDLAESLLDVARERTPRGLAARIEYVRGDMLDAGDAFDHVVAMDSLIHYATDDVVASVARLAAASRRSVCFTVAPRTPLLAVKHVVGRLVRGGDRAPAIVPVALPELYAALGARLAGAWRLGRAERVHAGFYTSQAVELVAADLASTDRRDS